MAQFISIQTDATALIDALPADAQPLWGMMTAQHLLEHLQLVIEVCIGGKNYPVLTPEDQIERTQAFLMSEKPMPREFKMPLLPKDELVPLRHADMDTARKALKQAVADFLDFWEKQPDALIPHPVFGLCNKAQWRMIQDKHFTHHFTQFGLIAAE